MAKQSPPTAQNSPVGTTIPPAPSMRLLGSGQFTLDGGVVLLNGSAEAAGNKQATELEMVDGPGVKATDSNGDTTMWVPNTNPVDPQGSWA
jgi:hypothetical protein